MATPEQHWSPGRNGTMGVPIRAPKLSHYISGRYGFSNPLQSGKKIWTLYSYLEEIMLIQNQKAKTKSNPTRLNPDYKIYTPRKDDVLAREVSGPKPDLHK